MLRSYANTTAFPIRDLSILEFWYSSGEPIHCRYQGKTVSDSMEATAESLLAYQRQF